MLFRSCIHPWFLGSFLKVGGVWLSWDFSSIVNVIVALNSSCRRFEDQLGDAEGASSLGVCHDVMDQDDAMHVGISSRLILLEPV